METQAQVLIPRSLAQALVEYLKQRSYVEVAHLIGGLSQARLANIVAEEKPPEQLVLPSQRKVPKE